MSSSSNLKKKKIGGRLPSSRSTGTSTSTSTASSPVQRLKDVVAAVHEEDHGTVVRLLLGGERTVKTYPPSIQKVLQRLYVESLLQNGQAKEALVELSKWDNHDEDGDSVALRAYALYKQKEYKQVISLINKQTASSLSIEKIESTGPTTLQYLRAQALYHLSDLDACSSLYHQLLLLQDDKTDLETRVQTYTNLVTARLADATPYCPTSCTESADDTLVSEVLTLLEKFNDGSGEDYPYDLAYSLATWQLITSSSSSSTQQKKWQSLLQEAITACRRANKDNDPSLLSSELAPLLINQELLTGTTTSATISLLDDSEDNNTDETLRTLPAAVQWARRVNQSNVPGVAALKQWLSQEPASSPITTTPLQKRLWYYNRAVLQLWCHKFEDCRSSCHFLALHLLRQAVGGGGGKKKSTTGNSSSSWSTLAVHDVQEQIWWEARIAVLLAHCARMQENNEDEEQEQNVASAFSALDGVVRKCQALPNSRLRDQTLTYLLTHKAAVEQNGSNDVGSSPDHHDIQLLDTIASALSSESSVKPAILSTKASLLLAANQETQAVALLQQLSNMNDPDALLTEFYLSQGHYEKAASLCETIVDGFSRSNGALLLLAKAEWVRALSYTDPFKAAQVWDEINPSIQIDDGDDDESHLLNGAELEAQELPRHTLGQQSSTRRVDSSLLTSSKKKKSRAAIIRRRARQREQYLKDKPQTHQPPDPERWIPKYERAARRRGRRQNNIIGSRAAQGGSVSAQEALQLDVAARQAARASGEIDTSRSTAHMTVSGSGGVRTGGKVGKRR